ncbi:MAG: hypothetical protein D3903_13650 [Candidatus Electrothrix sp. GM3_4]|nr:hypothetical protein [Candidatus Electrothrix sp. GM3_4]
MAFFLEGVELTDQHKNPACAVFLFARLQPENQVYGLITCACNVVKNETVSSQIPKGRDSLSYKSARAY